MSRAYLIYIKVTLLAISAFFQNGG